MKTELNLTDYFWGKLITVKNLTEIFRGKTYKGKNLPDLKWPVLSRPTPAGRGGTQFASNSFSEGTQY